MLCSKKTVAITLWGNAAEEAGGTLESLEGTHPVLSISNCRVTDFNGEHTPAEPCAQDASQKMLAKPHTKEDWSSLKQLRQP